MGLMGLPWIDWFGLMGMIGKAWINGIGLDRFGLMDKAWIDGIDE